MPTTLYDYYTKQGQSLPSLADRSKLYQQQGLGSAATYTGSVQQNTALLGKLQTSAAPTTPIANPNVGMQTPGALGGTPVPTSTPNMPAMPTTPTTPGAPQQQGGSSLLDYANSLDAVVNMGRQKRNASSLGMMMPSQGTLMASDFNSILGNLNHASDTTANDLTKRALEAAQPAKLTEVSPGASLYDPSTGKSLYTAPTVTQQNVSGGTTKPAAPIGGGAPSTFTKDDRGDVETALRAGEYNGTKLGNAIGDDGYIDPSVYVKLMNYWIQQGGTKESFFSNFSYKKYINPKNTWVWGDLDIPNPYVKKESTSGDLNSAIDSTF